MAAAERPSKLNDLLANGATIASPKPGETNHPLNALACGAAKPSPSHAGQATKSVADDTAAMNTLKKAHADRGENPRFGVVAANLNGTEAVPLP